MRNQQENCSAEELSPSVGVTTALPCPIGLTPEDLRSYLFEKKAGLEGLAKIRQHLEESACSECVELVRLLQITEPLLRKKPVQRDPYVDRLIRDISGALFGAPAVKPSLGADQANWTVETVDAAFRKIAALQPGCERDKEAAALRAGFLEHLSKMDDTGSAELDRWTQEFYSGQRETLGAPLKLARIYGSSAPEKIRNFLMYLLSTPGLLEAAGPDLYSIDADGAEWSPREFERSLGGPPP